MNLLNNWLLTGYINGGGGGGGGDLYRKLNNNAFGIWRK